MSERLSEHQLQEIRQVVRSKEHSPIAVSLLAEIDALRREVEASKAQLHEVAASTHEAMEQVKKERDGARAACMTNLMAADSWRSMCKKVEEMLERAEDECNELRRALEASNADG